MNKPILGLIFIFVMMVIVYSSGYNRGYAVATELYNKCFHIHETTVGERLTKIERALNIK